MSTVPCPHRSSEGLYLASPVADPYAINTWYTSSKLITPSWSTSGSREPVQLAVSVETLTLQAAPSQELPARIESTNLVVELDPYPTDTLKFLENAICP